MPVKCLDCGKEMVKGEGCTVGKVTLVHPPLDRIKYGDPREGGFSDDGKPCHDCNVSVGQYHHMGCDVERCPICLHQMVSCDEHEFLPLLEDEQR